jgi:membrane fusion protein, multidrug efflux system
MHSKHIVIPILLLLGCGSVSEAQPAPAVETVPVALATAGEIEVPHTLALTGTLGAKEESFVAADVAGRVVSTHVERGDFVEAGALLVRVDVDAASTNAAEARAQLEATRADDAQARLECERSELLWQRRAISEGEHDRDMARCQASTWSVRAAEARLARARMSVGDGMVRAPFGGLVAERSISAGEYVRTDTRVATLLDTSSLRLELTVPEADALAIAVGQKVSFTVSALAGETFEGTVRYLGPAIRHDSRDLTVEAIVENTDGRLRPGMFAVSELALGTQARIGVPREAVRVTDGTAHVFVASNDRVEERVVRLGPEIGTSIAILEGLSSGERVVSPVGAEIEDGIAFTTSH